MTMCPTTVLTIELELMKKSKLTIYFLYRESKGGSLKPKSFKTPQKSKQSLNLDSVNFRETFSEEKEKQMIEFALKNESDSRGYIKNF